MLIGFTFNNFCSFNIESEFSMEASTGKVKTRFPDNYTATDVGYDLLKTAVVVGENKQVELIGKPVVTVQNQIGDDKGEKDYNAIHQEDAPIWKSLFREIPIANFFE